MARRAVFAELGGSRYLENENEGGSSGGTVGTGSAKTEDGHGLSPLDVERRLAKRWNVVTPAAFVEDRDSYGRAAFITVSGLLVVGSRQAEHPEMIEAVGVPDEGNPLPPVRLHRVGRISGGVRLFIDLQGPVNARQAAVAHEVARRWSGVLEWDHEYGPDRRLIGSGHAVATLAEHLESFADRYGGE